jgi:hypothetical protein
VFDDEPKEWDETFDAGLHGTNSTWSVLFLLSRKLVDNSRRIIPGKLRILMAKNGEKSGFQEIIQFCPISIFQRYLGAELRFQSSYLGRVPIHFVRLGESVN